MKSPFFVHVAAFAGTVLLCACSPVSTRVDPPDGSTSKPSVDGLTYFLPLQAVIVSLVVDKKAKTPRTITISTSGVYADRSHRFVANYHANQAGTNAIGIKVDANGLLNGEITSTLTPKISDVLSGLATDFGYFTGKTPQVGIESLVEGGTPCDAENSYAWVVPLAMTGNATEQERSDYHNVVTSLASCKITFDARPLFNATGSTAALKSARDNDGLFYRQAVPYLLKVTDTSSGGTQGQFVTIATHDAPVEFLPAQRSLFAASSFAATFASGTPTAYSQSADSEWLGIVSIPATVLKAYVGAVTESFKDKEGLETEHVKALLAEHKRQACVAAVKSGVQASIDAACQ